MKEGSSLHRKPVLDSSSQGFGCFSASPWQFERLPTRRVNLKGRGSLHRIRKASVDEISIRPKTQSHVRTPALDSRAAGGAKTPYLKGL